ncbi:hypothetical protein NP233_g8503 [Leucocoprinus birnbaumii]|uniref:MIP18 family-like domain-containing protein n=1 Tax=Leucocoprinus birnbaumii TaxID=56174 RepID=A0AAD5VPP6_9AGAR|nr:hypothetical protein NP233_g8503 [Leucocoprinus birnbaumii]
MPAEIFNPNPVVFSPTKSLGRKSELLAHSLWIDEPTSSDDEVEDLELIDQDEIFDLIRSIYDPEHPNTLEELRVVSAPQIRIEQNRITVEFTPTVPHCGMSTLIGEPLHPCSHQSEHAVNKQLNDKERVAAALENPVLLDTVEQCLRDAGRRGLPIM